MSVWIVRRLEATSARFRRNSVYRLHLSSTEARYHVQFFTTLGRLESQPRWRNIQQYERQVRVNAYSRHP